MERAVGKNSKPKIRQWCVIKEETKKLGKKSLRDLSSRNALLVNKLEYKDTKKTLQV